MSGHEEGYPKYSRMWDWWHGEHANEKPIPLGGVVHAKRELTPTTIFELTDQLRAMGVADRHVMVHSSYKSIRPVENGPAGVVEAFVRAVGDQGVLLFPTYDFESWTERGYWNRQESPSRMGIISETARLDSRFKRSGHPMLSYAILGDLVAEGYNTNPMYPENTWIPEITHGYLENIHNGHGSGSIFDLLVKNNGLLLSFSGEGFQKDDVGFTLVNHSKTVAGVDYRFMKVFEGVYVDGGVASIRKYAASVSRRDKYRTAVTAAHVEAEKEGIIKRYPLGNTEAIVADARTFHEWAVVECVRRPELFRRVI